MTALHARSGLLRSLGGLATHGHQWPAPPGSQSAPGGDGGATGFEVILARVLARGRWRRGAKFWATACKFAVSRKFGEEPARAINQYYNGLLQSPQRPLAPTVRATPALQPPFRGAAL